jgi:cytoskeletal protein CcmA (bactofilin family)
MFNNKKEVTQSKKSIIPTTTSHSLNTLVKGTLVEGTVKSESDIRIDGVIKGTLNCNAKVIIGPSGFIEGKVRCANAVIEGKFEGSLQVTELLNVRENAKVYGDVITKKLIVQSGAVFNVDCKMGGLESNNNNRVIESLKATKPSVVHSTNKQQAIGAK